MKSGELSACRSSTRALAMEASMQLRDSVSRMHAQRHGSHSIDAWSPQSSMSCSSLAKTLSRLAGAGKELSVVWRSKPTSDIGMSRKKLVIPFTSSDKRVRR